MYPVPIPEFIKTEPGVIDYKVDWSDWLGVDLITSSTWDIPADLVMDSEEESFTDATVWISGGNLNTVYQLTNIIETINGRTDARSFNLIIGVK